MTDDTVDTGVQERQDGAWTPLGRDWEWAMGQAAKVPQEAGEPALSDWMRGMGHNLSGMMKEAVRLLKRVTERSEPEEDPALERARARHSTIRGIIEAVRPLLFFLQGIDPAVADVPLDLDEAEDQEKVKEYLPHESFAALSTAVNLADAACRKVGAVMDRDDGWETVPTDVAFEMDDRLAVLYLALVGLKERFGQSSGPEPFTEPEALAAIRRIAEGAYSLAREAHCGAQTEYDAALEANRGRWREKQGELQDEATDA